MNLTLNKLSSPSSKNDTDAIAFDPQGIKSKLLDLDLPCYFVKINGQIGATHDGNLLHSLGSGVERIELLASVPPMPLQQFGDGQFLHTHGVKYAYAAGAMAGGIASEEMVIALGKAKILSSFGTGGLSSARIESAIKQIQSALPQDPYAFNLLHSPNEPERERLAIALYLKHGVKTIEASAFLDLTVNLVHFRAAGLSLDSQQNLHIGNKIIAKLSRREVASKFLKPAPLDLLKDLVNQGLISEQQARLAQQVAIADDITVEADSGGHTDNRPLVCLFPSILDLAQEMQAEYRYPTPVRVGVAGGIGTPQSVLAALMMGAAYVVTGSINQSCREAGTSAHAKQLLSQAEMTDVMMAPAADMFEMGVKLQALKRGTLFPIRAQKLYELYKNYESLEAIPPSEREKLEKQIFRQSLDSAWELTQAYLAKNNPSKLARAIANPKLKMSLVFRWYLGLSSRWAIEGEKGREIDYQIWCGPAIGAFNEWVKGSYLADPERRSVIDVAEHLMTGAAYLYRIQSLKLQGLSIKGDCAQYRPPLAMH
jgi:trans-AT polyketide synthase/acyltransferase/oxidoreductase domain-containing protein